GSRFGSDLEDPSMCHSLLDVDVKNFFSGDGTVKVSITQAEALTAASFGIPLFTFVDAAVYHDYFVYQQNKDKAFATEISYPSISQPRTAEHIFRFINFLESRSYNNAVITFERLEDVVGHLSPDPRMKVAC
ncbi:MAG TPA: hypothetical protein VFC01_16980, partial [Mycobacterium sp.]|nr:hypothetical protein [Mycobacterium sp.]